MSGMPSRGGCTPYSVFIARRVDARRQVGNRASKRCGAAREAPMTLSAGIAVTLRTLAEIHDELDQRSARAQSNEKRTRRAPSAPRSRQEVRRDGVEPRT